MTGRVAVVIGATSGIGREIAIGLAAHGADVVPTGRRQAAVEEACCTIQALGRQTLACPADVRDRQSIDALREAVLDALRARGHSGERGRLHFHATDTATVCEEQWTSLMDTNLSGALRACQSFYEAAEGERARAH